MSQDDIHFYYPHAVIDSIPEAEGRYAAKQAGQYVWTVKTYGLLKLRGFPCRLTNVLPDAGVIITHRDFLPDHIRPNAKQLFVCIIADTSRHPYAQLHLAQNPLDPLLRNPDALWPAAFMPHWTESGLLARDPARGTTLTNVGYFGLVTRLAPALRGPEFAELMRQHGFEFRIIEPQFWNDYRDVDAVLALRSFAAVPFYKHPPTKLYNAWLAGVPALLGHESAYRAERRSELDYLEVRSVEQIITALQRLRSDPGLYRAVLANCAERAVQVSPERTAQHWMTFCDEMARPALAQWRSMNARQIDRYIGRRGRAYRRHRLGDYCYRAAIMLRKRLADRFDAVPQRLTEK